MAVSVVRLEEMPGSLRRALDLCQGFEGLDRSSRVLVKPNICLSEWMPLYGMVTTTSLLEGLVQLLAEQGCRDITIGEGPVDVFGLGLRKGFRRMGIDAVARRYGVKLADLNRGPFRTVDLEGVKVQVVEAAFENDFLVNVPALKTHNQVRVSLGFKNLKGFLAPASKVKFHGTNRLDHLVRLLAETVRPRLTVIDGTYALESGPDTALGRAHRTNVIVAGRDAYGCDVVGATLLGMDPAEVGHLREYGEAHALPAGAGGVELRGETDLAPLVRRLEWQVRVAEELAAVAGVTGLSIPHPGETLCSRCYAVLGYSLLALARDNRGADLGGAVVCCGREVRPGGDARKVILFGDCAAAGNRGLAGARRVPGCPPGIVDSMRIMWPALLSRSRIARALPARMSRLAAMKMGVYTDTLPKWERYRSAEFDPAHFQAVTTSR